MIDTLVIATDGSESGERAVIVALDLARRFGATVFALSVVDTTTDRDTDIECEEDKSERQNDGGGTGSEARNETDDRRQRAEEAVAAVARQVDREVHTDVREGAPAAAICSYAHEHSANLVAIGTRGRHGAHRFLLGSVAEEVVRTCPTPVLTVRQLDTVL